MLTAQGCLQRRERLWDAVPENVQWLLVADPKHICYLSGFWVNPISFSSHERSLLLLKRSGETTLFADNFVRRSAVATPSVHNEVVARWYDHQHSVPLRSQTLLESFFDHARELEPAAGMLEGEALPLEYASHSGVPGSRTDLGSVLTRLRRFKLSDEIELLKRCMRATEAGHARALEVIQPGMTEFELYREIQNAAFESAGVPAIVYGDFRATNAAAPKAGGLPTDYVLTEGDLFIADYSVVIQGYRSDFTNTLAVGEASAEQQRLYATSVAALEAAAAKLQPGIAASEVYEAASAVLVEAGYEPLAHHAGHGLGLGHPEAPALVPQSTDELMEGDVVTIEPGSYVPDVGGVRVEHNYAITASGSERLSHHQLRLTT